MKKLLTILLVLISFSSFAQFEAGEFVNSDTVKLDGVPLLLNTFKEGNLGGAGNLFYSTGASSQPASGSVTDVVGDNYIKNQNTSPQNANIWISGEAKIGTEGVIPKLVIEGSGYNEYEALRLSSVGDIDTDRGVSMTYYINNNAWSDHISRIGGKIFVGNKSFFGDSYMDFYTGTGHIGNITKVLRLDSDLSATFNGTVNSTVTTGTAPVE